MTTPRAAELIFAATEEIRSDSLCSDPLVSVCLITYNHAAFVREAIDSVLAQRTDFPFEIVIADDASTDGTAEIALDYQRRFPAQIRVLLARQNLGRHTGNGRLNLFRTMTRSRGRYLALLEGDDYWLVPEKLQAQVDLLESRPESALCSHNAYQLNADGSRVDYIHDWFGRDVPDRYGTSDVIWQNCLPTCSLVLRSGLVTLPFEGFWESPAADWILLVAYTSSGIGSHLDAIWGVRRVHAQGLLSSMTNEQKLRVNLRGLELNDRLTSGRYRQIVQRRMAVCHFRLARSSWRRRPITAAREVLASIRSYGAGLPAPRPLRPAATAGE